MTEALCSNDKAKKKHALGSLQSKWKNSCDTKQNVIVLMRMTTMEVDLAECYVVLVRFIYTIETSAVLWIMDPMKE